jgi:hypothetical protein
LSRTVIGLGVGEQPSRSWRCCRSGRTVPLEEVFRKYGVNAAQIYRWKRSLDLIGGFVVPLRNWQAVSRVPL